MISVSVMRILRQRYGITITELARAVGVSHQYISDLELGKYIEKYDYRRSGEALMQQAFERVVVSRNVQARKLAEDLTINRQRLLSFVEDNDEL